MSKSLHITRRFPKFRRSEVVLCAFLGYVAIIAAVAQVPKSTRIDIICLNLALLVAYTLLASSRPRLSLDIARDWLPLLFVLLTFHEMGNLTAPPHTHSLEARLVVWDHVIFRSPAKNVIESLGPILPTILELAYLLVYAIGPFSVAMLYAYHRRGRVDRFLFLFLIGVFLCYGQFAFWPSEPPRIVFPTEYLPTYLTAIRRLNLWLLRTGSIHTSVFPSGHVAAAFAAAAGMSLYLPEHPWVGRFLSVTAVLIAVATVYGRYHYVADAVAGLLMAGVAVLVARFFAPPERHPA